MSDIPHGTSGGYTNYACRCEPCTQAHTICLGKGRAKRLAGRVMRDGRLYHPDVTHGTKNAYGNYGCRCDPCTNAWTGACRERKSRAGNALA